MEVQTIASSSHGNAYALHPQDGGRTLLIEAGLPIRQLQVALRHRVTSLAALLVSHEHADHSRSAPQVASLGVPVIATPGTLKAIGLDGHHRARPLPLLTTTKHRDWRITAFPTLHDAAEPCGFYLAYGSERIIYVTDTAFIEYHFPEPLTLALVEANHSERTVMALAASGDTNDQHAARVLRNHLSVERAITLLQANNLTRCRAVHLLHLSDQHGDSEAFKRAVQRATGIPTHVAPKRTAA